MRRALVSVASMGLALGTLVGQAGFVNAQNSPTFRDCSLLVSGIDPDWVQLYGVNLTSQHTLAVPSTQTAVQVEASESSDPGDSKGADKLTVTVTSANLPTQTFVGFGIGRVVLNIPLASETSGRTYTISWAALFDNGNRPCPGPLTRSNTKSTPFVVTVS